jgi:membrane associated rhomboid family serine protease/Flp pilus assembly protein TadD
LANCRQCGTKLPSLTFGEASPYCKTCRSQISSGHSTEAIHSLAQASNAAVMSKARPATYVLVAINIAIFIAMMVSGISAVDPATDKVLRWGADYGPYTLDGQYWRLITSMFLHFGIIHILANMWCLWSLGRLAEELLGPLSVIGSYLLTGVGASLLSLSWNPMRVSAGASGAIFGIAGVLITVLYYGQHGLPKENVRSLLGYVVRFSLLNLLFGLRGHVDNMAHLGGLVTGLIIGLFLARSFKVAFEERPAQHRMIFAISALVLAVLVVPVAKAKQYAVEFGKGVTALDHNETNAAIEHLQKYTVARPDDSSGHELLGSAFQQAKRLNEAAHEFERGLTLDPDDPYAQINLAKIYAYQKKTLDALVLFRKAISRVEPDAGTYYMYAYALKDEGRGGEAEDMVRRAIRLEPKDADAHQLLGEIFRLEDKNTEAAAERKRAEELALDKATHSSEAPH